MSTTRRDVTGDKPEADLLRRYDDLLQSQAALRARLRLVEHTRAELVRDLLELASSKEWRKWEARRARNPIIRRFRSAPPSLERLVEMLVQLDLRTNQAAAGLDGAERPAVPVLPPPDPASIANPVLVLIDADGTAESVRRTLDRVSSRSLLPIQTVLLPSRGGTTVPAVEALRQGSSRLSAANSSLTDSAWSVRSAGAVRQYHAYSALLQPGAVVTYGWLHRLINCGDSDDRIGIVVPLSNVGDGPATVPLPAGLTVSPDAVSLVAGVMGHGLTQELTLLRAPCWIVKRVVLETVGPPKLDSPHGHAYALDEFAMRVRAAGWSLVAAGNTYVHYEGPPLDLGAGRSKASRRVLKRSYGRRQFAETFNPPPSLRHPLMPILSAISEITVEPHAFAAHLRASELRLLRLAYVLPAAHAPPRAEAEAAVLDVLSLKALGVPAELLVLGEGWAPIAPGRHVPKIDELADLAARLDVVVAAHPAALQAVRAVCKRHPRIRAFHFLGDAAPPSVPGDIPTLVSSLRTLEALQRRGSDAMWTEPGVDDDLFRPPPVDRRPGDAVQITARLLSAGAAAPLEILDRLRRQFGNRVTISTFGVGIEALQAQGLDVTRWREAHLGPRRGAGLAETLRRTNIFVDTAVTDVGGRTALAAMATGAAVVAARGSGFEEIATEGEDALFVSASGPDAWFAAVAELVDDEQRLAELQRAAALNGKRHGKLRTGGSRYGAYVSALQPRN